MSLNIKTCSYIAYLSLVLFIITFPKGGIKIGDIPITWGYLLCFLYSLFFFPFALSDFLNGKSYDKISFIRLFILNSSLIIVFLLSFNGFINFGFTLSLVINFIFFPFFFFYLYLYFSKYVLFEERHRIICYSVLFISVFGVLLFLYRIYFGEFFVIPYLTVNAADADSLGDKYIDRGGVFKLISTYNNGNIFGVSLLMLLPLYCYYQKNNLFKFLVKLSLILTLSRTVWIGLVIFEIFTFSFSISKMKIKHLIAGIMFFTMMSFFVLFLIDYLGWGVDFLFDKNLGGRAENLSVLSNIMLVSFSPFDAISEMTFLSFLRQFGLIPTVFVYLSMMSPLIIYIFDMKIRTKAKDSIAFGLLIYLIVSQSDGASLFIPVMAIYWMLAAELFVQNESSVNSQIS